MRLLFPSLRFFLYCPASSIFKNRLKIPGKENGLATLNGKSSCDSMIKQSVLLDSGTLGAGLQNCVIALGLILSIRRN